MRRTATADLDGPEAAGDFGESAWGIGWPDGWALEDVMAAREGGVHRSTGDHAMQTATTTLTTMAVPTAARAVTMPGACERHGATERSMATGRCIECARASDRRRYERAIDSRYVRKGELRVGHPCRKTEHRDETGRTLRYVKDGRCVACSRQRARQAYARRRAVPIVATPRTFDALVGLIGSTPGSTSSLVFRRVALAALLEHMTVDEIADAFFVARVSGATYYRLRAELETIQGDVDAARRSARQGGVAQRSAA
jgi:hypothetical protein